MARILLPVFLLAVAACTAPRAAHAQRYRYMDSSGNLHFVDSLADVPRPYREQVIPPTPTPVLTTRQRNDLQRAKEREFKTRQQQMERKKREMERVRRSIEREQKLRSKQGGSRAEPPSSQTSPSREDAIEVIR